MRIFNRRDFLKLPGGIIFAKGKKWYFNNLQVKADTIFNDFVCLDLCEIELNPPKESWEQYEEMLEKGLSFPLDYTMYGRDGLFSEDELFLVFEPEDIKELINILNKAININIGPKL